MYKSLQFELWQECNSRCKFCYLGNDNLNTPDNLKIKAIDDAINFIKDKDKIKNYECVGLIGGEFFQGQISNPDVNKKFFELIELLSEYIHSNKIKAIWITASLLLGEQKDLYKTIDYFKDIPYETSENGLWVITSYDTIYRFFTDKRHKTWENHMLNIHKLYPNVKFNTTMILTQDLINKYLNDEFSFKEYQEKYHSLLFFKQPCVPQASANYRYYLADLDKKLPNFFPTRNEMTRFLKKVLVEDYPLYDKLFNIKYRADDLYRNFNTDDKRMVYSKRNKITCDEPGDINPKCGHVVYYQCYKDSDACCLCDKIALKNNFYL